MCTLKSPMSQLLSNKSVKVFSAPKRRGGGGGGGTLPPNKFLLGGVGGEYGPPAPPYFAAFEVVEQLKVTQCG